MKHQILVYIIRKWYDNRDTNNWLLCLFFQFMKYFTLKENLHDGYTMTYRNIGDGNLYFAHDSYKKNLLFLVQFSRDK